MAFGGQAGALFNSGGFGVASYGDTGTANQGRPTPMSSGPEGLGQFVGAAAHTFASLGKMAIGAAVTPVRQAADTVAGIPEQLAHAAVGTVKETAALATDNKQAYASEVAKQNAYRNTSYIGREYGQGNAASLAHAAEFGGTALTLGAGMIPEDAAKTGVGLADRVLNQAKDLVGAGKGNVVSKSVRNAVLTQPTIQFAGKTYQDVAQGNLHSAALDAAMWGLPGAASVAAKPVKAAIDAAGGAIFGKASILNDMFTPEVVQRYVTAHPEDATTLKQIEQFTLNQRAVGGKADLASPWLKNYVQATIPGVTQNEDGLATLVRTMKPYANEMTKLQDLQASKAVVMTDRGVEIPAHDLTVSHNFVQAVPAAKAAIDTAINDPRWASNMQFRLQSVKEAVGSLGIADETLNAQVSDALLNSNNSLEASQNLDDVLHAGQKQIVKDLGNGFVYTAAPNYAAHMPTPMEVANNELIPGKSPTKLGAAVGQAITKAGLSPKATPNSAISQSLEENLGQHLEDLGITTHPRDVLNLLRDKASRTPGVSDLRMLTAKNIEEAVTNNSELSGVPGRVLAGALRAAHRDIPAELTGLGPKLTNAVMNPALSQYLRAQGMGRFELNPVFLFGKVPIKGGIVAVAHGADVNEMAKSFIGLSKDTQDILKRDRGGNWFSASSRGGESGTSAELGIGDTGKQVGYSVKSQITALVDSVAKAHGVTPADIINERGELYNELQKGVGLIKGYGTGGYLNSPLAKTLNLLVFPSRFDTKVVQSAAKIMGRMSALQQVAVIHSAAQLHGFLSSPEGKQWSKDNSEALGLLGYFSPTETFNGVYNFVAHGQHVQDLGEIGGLPFGIVTQMLTHQVPDLGHLGGSQYFDPKTGQPVPSAIPVTLRARAQQALQDIVSSMFSWPGQAAGLVSKKNVVTAGGKNPLVTPAKNEVEYRFANGALEGSPNAPVPQGGATPPPLPAASNQPAPPQVAPISEQPTLISPTSRSTTRRAARPKSIPVSQQLPGSNQF